MHSISTFKRFLLTFLLLSGISLGVNAQSYTLDPGTYISGTVEQNGWLNLQINMHNELSNDLRLEWELVSSTMDTAWSITLCDYQACYNYIPSGRRMEPVPVGGAGVLKLTINPGMAVGNGVAIFDVWLAGDTTNKDRLTFEVDAIVGVDDPALASLVVYPNPTSEFIRVEDTENAARNSSLSLYQMDGKMLRNTGFQATNRQEMFVGDLPNGLYLLHIQTEDGASSHKIRIQH